MGSAGGSSPEVEVVVVVVVVVGSLVVEVVGSPVVVVVVGSPVVVVRSPVVGSEVEVDSVVVLAVSLTTPVVSEVAVVPAEVDAVDEVDEVDPSVAPPLSLLALVDGSPAVVAVDASVAADEAPLEPLWVALDPSPLSPQAPTRSAANIQRPGAKGRILRG